MKLIFCICLKVDKHERFLETDTNIKGVRVGVDFLFADKHQSLLQVDFSILGMNFFFKVILALFMDMIKHFYRTQSNKFAMSLQYLEKEVRDRVHIFHGDKHRSF